MTQFKHLSVTELHDKLTDQPIQIVDIRDSQSFNLGHVPGAVHLTNDNLSQYLLDADPDLPTVVCCYHGISSQQAAQYLISQDYTEVYSLDGGYTAWQAMYPNER